MESLVKLANDLVKENATAGMLVMDLYSLLDEKENRKVIVEEMLNGLREKNKISNTVYRKALDIL